MRKVLVLFLLILFYNCEKKDIPIKISLHENWQFKGIDTLDWKTATVPGNVFTDLLTNKIISNPFVETNEEKVQWVSNKSWEYKTSFILSEKILEKKNIEINFEGLDTYSTIYLNDSLLGKTNNAFKNFSFNIKKLAKKENSLKIIFTNTNEIETTLEEKNPYKLPVEKRVYTRKAQFQYGWDWGPILNTSGIWKGVFINAWNDLKIKDIFIKQKNINDTIANFSANIELNTAVEGEIYLNVFVNDKLVSINSLKSELNKENYTVNFSISNPKLWWTHNLGEPYLYNIKVVAKKDDIILDTYALKKGIRTIKLINKKDSIGESFYFELNGKPVYMKGANYIPQNSFQKKVTNEHYEKLLSDVVESNMNMLRVWGGGIYENDIFYDLCDEKGILVWQDFMFACAMYPGDTEFLTNIKEEAEQQLKRLRNHASIALWCGNNENSEGWKRWGWKENRGKKEIQDIWNDYLLVFNDLLPKVVAENSETDYWETSPKYGRGNPNYELEGDAHDWWIWHDGYPFEHLENHPTRFMSEFGFQSFPSFKAINYINQKDTIDIKTAAIISHQKHERGFQIIDEYMARDYKIPTNDEDYVYVSQLLQAKGIVMGIEAQRRAKPYNMGTLYWQLNDVWPAISWSSMDYFGNWKALQFKAKKAFENVLISPIIKNDSVKTFIINDNFRKLNGDLNLKIIDFYGKEIWSDTKEIKVLKNSSKNYYSFSLDSTNLKSSVLITEFNHQKSYFYFTKPKDLELPKGEILQKISKTKNGFSITLKSEVLQKDVFLFTSQKGYFSDNFFDLLPNEEKILFFETNEKLLEELKVKTLNKINFSY